MHISRYSIQPAILLHCRVCACYYQVILQLPIVSGVMENGLELRKIEGGSQLKETKSPEKRVSARITIRWGESEHMAQGEHEVST